MTPITSVRAPTGSLRRPFPLRRLGVAVLLLGVAVFAVAVHYALVEPGYSLLSETSTAQGESHKEVLGLDGKLYSFTGDDQAATQWFRNLTEQLDGRYHVDEQHQLGDRLAWAGASLAGVGLLLVGVGAVAAIGRRRSRA